LTRIVSKHLAQLSGHNVKILIYLGKDSLAPESFSEFLLRYQFARLLQQDNEHLERQVLHSEPFSSLQESALLE
jgi:hypothetical protein